MRRTTLEDRLEDNATTEAALAAWEEVAQRFGCNYSNIAKYEFIRGVFCAGFACGGMRACDEHKRQLEAMKTGGKP